MRTSVSAFLLALLVACSSGTKPPVEPGSGTGTGTGTGAASGTGSASAGSDLHGVDRFPGIGETCAGKDTCAEGLTCVSYYGIAGASGPMFKSCEKKCGTDDDCPAPRKCATIADGPGRVCR